MSQVSAPVSTTVIAGDIAGAASFGAAVMEAFEAMAVVASSLGYVTQDAGRPNLTLTLAPELALGAPLETLAQAATGFDGHAGPLRVRIMVHFGVVFRAESAEGVGYVGSAIRSTQSALRRAPATGGFLATAEFASHAGAQPGLPFHLSPLAEAAAVEGLHRIVFGAPPPGAGGAAGSSTVDAELIAYARKRLAEEIGPFANALAERAGKTTTALDQFLTILAREVDAGAARNRFEADVLQFAKSRGQAR